MANESAYLLRRLADHIVDVNVTIYVHTADPGNAGTTGRVVVGGGFYESGLTVAPAGWTVATDAGLVRTSADAEFGAADEDLGTLTHVSYWHGTNFVSSAALSTSRTVNNGDSFTLPAGTSGPRFSVTAA